MPSPFKIAPEKTMALGARTGSFNMIGCDSPVKKTKYFGVETNFGAQSELKKIDVYDQGIEIYN
jgi:hypothetical protein